MTHITNGSPRFAILALAAAALAASACEPVQTSSCATGGFASVHPWAPSLVSFSPGSTCTTTDIGGDRIGVSTSTGERCAFTAELMGGATFVVIVDFEQLDPDGCPGVYRVAGDPEWHYVDPERRRDGGAG